MRTSPRTNCKKSRSQTPHIFNSPLQELETDPAVQELLTKRKDLEILSLSNRQDRFSDKMKEMKVMIPSALQQSLPFVWQTLISV